MPSCEAKGRSSSGRVRFSLAGCMQCKFQLKQHRKIFSAARTRQRYIVWLLLQLNFPMDPLYRDCFSVLILFHTRSILKKVALLPTLRCRKKSFVFRITEPYFVCALLQTANRKYVTAAVLKWGLFANRSRRINLCWWKYDAFIKAN